MHFDIYILILGLSKKGLNRSSRFSVRFFFSLEAQQAEACTPCLPAFLDSRAKK